MAVGMVGYIYIQYIYNYLAASRTVVVTPKMQASMYAMHSDIKEYFSKFSSGTTYLVRIPFATFHNPVFDSRV